MPGDIAYTSPMLELEEALARILAVLPKPARERVPLREARGRILLEPVSAAVDLPVFDNSAVDGYAVRSVDDVAPQTTLAAGTSVQVLRWE